MLVVDIDGKVVEHREDISGWVIGFQTNTIHREAIKVLKVFLAEQGIEFKKRDRVHRLPPRAMQTS